MQSIGLQEVTGREDKLAKSIGGLHEAANKKKAALEDALALCEFKDVVKSWTDQHVSRFDKLVDWLKDMEARAAKPDDTATISGCQSGISNCAVLSGLVGEHRDNIEALLSLGKKLAEAKHGNWSPEQKELDAVRQRQEEVVSRRDKLHAALQA